VVIESTSQTWAVVELLSRHVERVTLSNPMRTRAIALISVEATDLFGRKGRRALQSVDLPAHERENVDCALRLHDALDGEIRLVEKALADRALKDSGARLLMSIPGVGPMTSLSIVSVIGDIGRFESSRQLVSYFGLDPRVRQSGERAARHGHISREGQAHARGLLVEAAHSAVRSPGPLRAFYQRIRSRRGTKIAICATTRKLLTIAWQLLTKQEPYRYEAPSATRRKVRLLQRAAGRTELVSLAGEREARVIERRLLEMCRRITRLTSRSASRSHRSAAPDLVAPDCAIGDVSILLEWISKEPVRSLDPENDNALAVERLLT